ncbi:NUDIX domain-containing protein [Mucilaginibacter sp. AW1-3]
MNIPSELYQSILKSIPILCVDALIVNGGKCLLLLRDNEPAKGTYWFPGGRVHKNELIKDAVLRKVKEETNLTCVFEKIISVEETMFEQEGGMATDVHTVNVCCLLHAVNIDELEVDKLHAGFKWVNALDESYHPGINNPLSLLGYV